MKLRILPFFLAILFCFPCPILAQEPVSVSAQSAVLLECSRRETIYARNECTRLPMASTTKIMTALVALESGDLKKTFPIPEAAVGVEGSSVYLQAGEYLSLEDLLYAVMLESANDAAAAVACIVGGSIEGFADLMNAKAAELGLSDTHFTNPHGLDDENHYTTALDLAKLAACALENPTFAAIVSTERKTIPLHDGEGTRVLVNHNRLLRQYEDVIGVKTGFTKHSGRCLVSAAEKDGVRLVAVTLNAPDDWQDHRSLLDYGFTRYEAVTLASPGTLTISFPCTGGVSETITAVNREGLTLVLPAGTEIATRVESRPIWFAPVEAGQVVGVVRFFVGSVEIGSVSLVAEAGIPALPKQRTLLEKILDF